MSAEAGRRRYDSLRRTAQAQETRAEIARAARRLFVSQGWAATTVRDVAREAGVSVPTVYAAYGNKAGLTLALADAADLSADVPQMVAELEASAADPERQLVGDGRLRPAAVRARGRHHHADARGGPHRARTGHGLSRRAPTSRRDPLQVFSSWPAGVLRRGLDVRSAVDVYAALCNIDVYTTLTAERGWSPDRVEQWWCRALARELLG